MAPLTTQRAHMRQNRFSRSKSLLSDNERRRRKREIILIFAIIAVVAVLTYIENRVIHFGAEFPISNTILMFILININLLLLILLIFLVFRNLVKLLYDRKRKIMGARLRTKLVAAFIALTLLPTTVLFIFSIHFITTSIEFWFNVPVEQALENSLKVGRSLYAYIEDDNRFYLQRIAYQIQARGLMKFEKRKDLANYIEVVQRAFNQDAVEVYASSSERVARAASDALADKPFPPVSADNLYTEMESNGVRSFSESMEYGELSRTIGTVPFEANYADAEGFVALSVLVPPELSENLASISRGAEEYQQIKLLKKPIQITYFITISIVASLVLFCAIWFGFYLAKSISIPIMELAEATRKVAEGDLTFAIGVAADDEIGSLVDAFNKMTRDLRIGREQIELSAGMLREQNVEIEEKRRYMEIVLRNVSTGVITLDARGRITTTNKSAEKMLNIDAGDILNRSYKSLLQGEFLELADEVMEKLAASQDNSAEFPLRLAVDGRPKSLLMRVNALKDDQDSYIGAVMAFDDLTDQEKAQRMAAWREVARRIAHEVKNPLTPITLSAQRLKRKYSRRINDPIFDECTRMIIDHVDLIRNLVNEFTTFARFPTANPVICDLPPIIDETLALYREGHPDIRFETRTAETLPRLNLDRRQIKQAMINLVDNAVGAVQGKGTVVITTACNADGRKVRIEVSDDGPGISDEDKTRLFEPYFSTKKAGMGLGLTIVSSIIADHNGVISVADNDPGGARFIIELPA